MVLEYDGKFIMRVVENDVKKVVENVFEYVPGKRIYGVTSHGATVLAQINEHENVILLYNSKNIDAKCEIYPDSMEKVIYLGPLYSIGDYDIDLSGEPKLVFEMVGLFTEDVKQYTIESFIKFLNMLNVTRWPGTKVPIILKAYEEEEIHVGRREVIVRSKKTGRIIETSFATPVGKISPINNYEACVSVGEHRTKISPFPRYYHEFIENYYTATDIVRYGDIIQEQEFEL